MTGWVNNATWRHDIASPFEGLFSSRLAGQHSYSLKHVLSIDQRFVDHRLQRILDGLVPALIRTLCQALRIPVAHVVV